MPFRVLHYAEPALDVVEVTGFVHWGVIAAGLRALYLRPDWAPGTPVLWDVTGITNVDVPPTDLSDIGATFAEVAAAREGGRTAVLVGPKAEQELWVLFPHLGPPSTRRVVVTQRRAEALAFLGLGAMPEGGVVVGASSVGAGRAAR